MAEGDSGPSILLRAAGEPLLDEPLLRAAGEPLLEEPLLGACSSTTFSRLLASTGLRRLRSMLSRLCRDRRP